MSNEIAPKHSSLMTVIEQLASNPNVDIDKLRQLLEMQERWAVNQDKLAFSNAMAEFKRNPPAIVKNRIAEIKSKDGGKDFKYLYADLDAVLSETQVALAQKGITHSWRVSEDKGLIFVACVLRYGLYEEVGHPLSAPPDASGFKNIIQQKGSTTNYLERYTYLAAVGMATDMPDSDGAAPAQIVMDKEAHDAHLKLIQESGTLAALNTYFQAAVKEARVNKDSVSEKTFIAAKDVRKKELGNAAH